MKDFSGKLISTWPVLTEVCYMLDFNKETQLDFLEWIIQGGIQVYNIEQWQLSRIRTQWKPTPICPPILQIAR